MKRIYHVFSARLTYAGYNKYVGELHAANVDEAKELMRKSLPEGGLNLNPFYAVIIDTADNSVVFNEQLPIQIDEATYNRKLTMEQSLKAALVTKADQFGFDRFIDCLQAIIDHADFHTRWDLSQLTDEEYNQLHAWRAAKVGTPARAHTFSFTLLSEFRNGDLVGPMSPMDAAKLLAESVDEKLVAVYRIHFKTNGDYNNKMYQVLEAGEGYTGYDHLLICFPQWVAFSIDRGTGMTNVAACFGLESAEEVDIKVKAGSREYAEHLSDEQLINMMRQGYQTAMLHKDELAKQFKQWEKEQFTS